MRSKLFLIYVGILLLVVACATKAESPPSVDGLAENGEISITPSEVPAEDPTVVTDELDVPPWATLGLTGQLYYIGFIAEQQHLLKLDLVTGEETTIFQPADNAWLSDIAVSPDGRQIVLAYAPPPEEGAVQFGFTDLYIMPADGSAAPMPLIQRQDPSETYFNVSWPVSDYIYYAHFLPSVDDMGAITYASQVERLQYPEKSVEVIAPKAAWPRASYDGSLLAYVTEANELIVSAADGSNPEVVLEPDVFRAVDAPLFSQDGWHLYFSAVTPDQIQETSLWDLILGVKVASAHSVPSDWYRMPPSGAEEGERVTELNVIGLYGDFSLDGEHMAFIEASGVQVMNPDGSNLFRLRDIPTVGTIDWVP